MDVDYRAVDEQKESSGGAHLLAPEEAGGSLIDSPRQPAHGQRAISMLDYHLLPQCSVVSDAPVCALSPSPGALLVSPCPPQPVDTSGKPICAGCPTRLCNCRGKLYDTDKGQICQRCYNIRRRGPPARSTTTPPARSHKRASFDTPASAPPPATHTLHDRASWEPQGWQFVRGDKLRIAMSQDWLDLVTSTEPGGCQNWREMRAQFFEHNMRQPVSNPALEQQRTRVVSNAEQLGRALLVEHGMMEEEYQLSDIGCLRTTRHHGLQEIHCDIQQFKYAHLCYIVLVYLCDTESTAVADVRRDELDPCWKMNIPQATRLFENVRFLTERVHCGDALIMNGKTFHYGVGNLNSHDRYVGFLSFTPKSLPPFDSQEQFYPTGTRSPSVLPTARLKRPYDTLGPTQQWKRRKQLHAEVTAAVDRAGAPLTTINPPPIPSPSELIHLPTSVREQIRSVPSLRIPSEQTMIKCKQHSCCLPQR
jgi:hypothetical protein